MTLWYEEEKKTDEEEKKTDETKEMCIKFKKSGKRAEKGKATILIDWEEKCVIFVSNLCQIRKRNATIL